MLRIVMDAWSSWVRLFWYSAIVAIWPCLINTVRVKSWHIFFFSKLHLLLTACRLLQLLLCVTHCVRSTLRIRYHRICVKDSFLQIACVVEGIFASHSILLDELEIDCLPQLSFFITPFWTDKIDISIVGKIRLHATSAVHRVLSIVASRDVSLRNAALPLELRLVKVQVAIVFEGLAARGKLLEGALHRAHIRRVWVSRQVHIVLYVHDELQSIGFQGILSRRWRRTDHNSIFCNIGLGPFFSWHWLRGRPVAHFVGLLTNVRIEIRLLMPVEMKDQIDHNRLHNTSENVKQHSRNNRLELFLMVIWFTVRSYCEEYCNRVAQNVHQTHGDVEAHRAAIWLQERILFHGLLDSSQSVHHDNSSEQLKSVYCPQLYLHCRDESLGGSFFAYTVPWQQSSVNCSDHAYWGDDEHCNNICNLVTLLVKFYVTASPEEPWNFSSNHPVFHWKQPM